MSNILQARVILRHGNNADFDASAVEIAELVFAEDVGIIYIKKKDGTILAIGPYVESSDNKVTDPAANIAAADKANKYPSLAFLEGNYDKSSEVTSKINTAKTELQRIIRQQAEGVENKHYFNDIEFNTQTGVLSFLCDGQPTGKSITLVATGGGLAFDRIYWDKDTGLFHIYQNDVDVVDPIVISGGSGGAGGSTLVFSCYTNPSFSVIESAGTAPITFKFTSVDNTTDVPTGAGTLAISVGGIVRTNLTVQQGDNLSVDVFRYLTTGNNTVRLVMTDSYGMTATRTFNVTLEAFTLEWSLNDTNVNEDENLSFYITPTGNGSKTIYTYVDGSLYSTNIVTTSGRRLTKTISGLNHGAHNIEVYGTLEVNGEPLESNHLRAAVAQVVAGQTAKIVAANFPSGDLTQFTSVSVPYIVIDPENNPTSIDLKQDSTVLASISVDQSEKIWAYRPAVSGSHTLSIKCGEAVASKSYTINPLAVNTSEVTDGLVLKVDPSTIADLSTWSQNGYRFTMSEHFDLINGGLTTDENNVHCIRITAGDRLTLNYDPFVNDVLANGMEIKIIYKIAHSSSKEAVGITSLSNGKGLVIKANNAYLYGNQNSIQFSTCEDEKAELDINIQKATDNSDKLMYIWESCSTFGFKQYAEQEDFQHSTSVGITFGSDDADVYLYLLRAYDRDLTNTELKANFIVDGADGTEISDREYRNDIYSNGVIDIAAAAAHNPDAHFITIHAPDLSLSKENAKVVEVSHEYIAGGDEHQFTAENTKAKIQGTSSVEHAETAGPNINLTFSNGIKLNSGGTRQGYAMHGAENSIPVAKITYKKNIASQDHIINRACAEWYNRFQPSKRAARVTDPRVRDCLESTMCVVFYHNTSTTTAVTVGPDIVQPGETIFFGLGNICSNKDSVEAFAYDPIVIEVKNNTEPQVRFKSNDLSGNNFSKNYEFRYLDTTQFTEAQAIALWKSEVQDFVYACDWTNPSGNPLVPAVTINGVQYDTDNAAYRKAKWKAEAADHFDMDTLYFHHNITLFFLLRDNRAKNMFWSRNANGKWGLWFNWDNDTGLCRNNEGYVDIEPGYMDFDVIGTAAVFNGADNALFTNLRECNFDQLKASYLASEIAGAWDIDAFYAYCCESQEQICESLWIEDAEHNAIRTLENLHTSAYLERATGRLRLHIKKALMFQKVLVDSYYLAKASTDDSAAFRGYTPETWEGVEPSGIVTIKPYTDMYINLLAGSTPYRVRASATGAAVQIDVSARLNDSEIYIRNAGWIKEMGDLSALYLGQFEASKLKRVKKLLIGSSEEGYYNTAFTTASFDNCLKLEELNLGGLVNANRSFDFSNNIYLKTIYTKDSTITGIRFAKNGRLRVAHLNAVSSLYLSGLALLETFDIDSYDNLTSLTIENCALLNSLDIVSACIDESLEHLRATGINWQLQSTDLLDKLLDVRGYNDSGRDQEEAYLTGAVSVPIMRESKLQAYNTAWNPNLSTPNVTFSYDSMVQQYPVVFKNYDNTTLYTEYVDRGEDGVEPVAAGLLAAPTKPETEAESFTFNGWTGGSLISVTGPVTLTATYSSTPQQYRVRFINNGSVIQDATQMVNYGAAATLPSEIPEKTIEEDQLIYNVFKGWDKSTGFIRGNLDVNALYQRKELPEVGASTHNMTAAEFYGIVQSNNTSRLSKKDRTKIRLGFVPDYLNTSGSAPIYTDICNKRKLSGAEYIDTEIQPLKDGIDTGWTLVCDLEFLATTSEQTMVCCYKEDGSMGFKIKYSGGVSVMWGESSRGLGRGTQREMIVLRHIPGSKNLMLYASNTYALQIDSYELTKDINSVSNAHLYIGATVTDGGDVGKYANGIMHFCRYYTEDLGDSICRKIANYPTEEYWIELCNFGGYYLTESSVTQTDVDFKFLTCLWKTMQMNTTNTNAGGYDATIIGRWILARLLPALPQEWQSILADCRVMHNNYVDGTTHNVVTSNVKISILDVVEFNSSTTTAPWSQCGEPITYYVNDSARIHYLGITMRENYVTFTQGTDPTLDVNNNVQEGDLWVDTSNSNAKKVFDGLVWRALSATGFWLRSAPPTNSANFAYVNSSGTVGAGYTNANYSYGVLPRFSIKKRR